MGKENNVLNDYLADRTRFADLVNGVLYQGRQVLQPECLTEISGVTYEALGKQGTKLPRRAERRNDIAMRYEDGNVYRIFLHENQDAVSYSLPLRNLNYISAGYQKQFESLRAQHKQAGDFRNFAEKASGIRKEDRLVPIHLLWLYYGEEAWNGPRTLRDMMDFGDAGEVGEWEFTDFPPHLVCLNEVKDFTCFRTKIRELFMALQARSDKDTLWDLLQNDRKYETIDKDTLEAMAVLLHMPSLWEKRREYRNRTEDKEEYNMCTAVKQYYAELNEANSKWKETKGRLAETRRRLAKAEERVKKEKQKAEQEKQKAEIEKHKAEQEKQKAEQERQKAETYRKLLIANGIDPDGE
ncbi:MAG: hypothetical protein IJ600_04715 [Lachnospiraceae bacterium]|nr:hypothetical protein [Lachnospiraceae bacterium]